MAAIVTNNFRALNAKNFMEDIRAELSNVYVGVGKSTAWQSANPNTDDYTDSDPAIPTDTIDHINQARANMIGMKLLSDNDVSHVCPRHDWEIGKVFTPWDSRDADIFDAEDKPFYCLTPDFKVYKCIDAPVSGAGVSDIPISIGASVFGTSDGYRWKYMYTILATDVDKFLTRSYMPVQTLTVSTTGLVATNMGGTGTSFTLDDENPDIMIGQTISGVANGATTPSIPTANTRVTEIVGKTITVSDAVQLYDGNKITFGAFLPEDPLRAQQLSQENSAADAEVGGIERIVIKDGGTGFGTNKATIANNLFIVGDGTLAAITNTTLDGQPSIEVSAGGTLQRIIPSNSGKTYSLGEIVVGAGGGTGLNAYPVIAPASGHGVDPVAELGGFYIGLNTQISGIDDTDIANNQDFRQISIIKNPTVNGEIETTAVAAARGSSRGTFRATKFLNVNANSTAALNEIINILATGADVFIEAQAADGTTGQVAGAYVVNAVNDGSTRRIFYCQNVTTGYQTFASGAILNYQSEGALTDSTNTIEIVSTAQDTDFKKGSGEVLFLENRAPIQRSSTQIEDIKLILEF